MGRGPKRSSSHDDNANALKHESVLGLQRSVKLVKGKAREPQTPTFHDDDVNALRHESVLGLQRSVELVRGKRAVQDDTAPKFANNLGHRGSKTVKTSMGSTTSALEIKRGSNQDTSIGGYVRTLAISAALVSIVVGLMHSVVVVDGVKATRK